MQASRYVGKRVCKFTSLAGSSAERRDTPGEVCGAAQPATGHRRDSSPSSRHDRETDRGLSILAVEPLLIAWPSGQGYEPPALDHLCTRCGHGREREEHMLRELISTLKDVLECGDLAGHLRAFWRVATGQISPFHSAGVPSSAERRDTLLAVEPLLIVWPSGQVEVDGGR